MGIRHGTCVEVRRHVRPTHQTFLLSHLVSFFSSSSPLPFSSEFLVFRLSSNPVMMFLNSGSPFLPSPPECQGYNHLTTCVIYVVLGVKTRTLGMPGKLSSNWATPLAQLTPIPHQENTGGTENWTRGLMNAKQVLYHRAVPPVLFVFLISFKYIDL